eukprot:Phypoly_transcript_12651.p1 GENE.Phypoly_transcript_12651~~Phypoly_transcript_12651.p1  ORF type:complete len:319 (+),score=42.54 Phypoly_transcript_12651:78-959(+)
MAQMCITAPSEVGSIIVRAGAIKPLVRLLGDSSILVQDNSAAALCNLAMFPNIHQSLISKRVIPALDLFLDSPLVNAAKALNNLAQNPHTAELVHQAGATPLLAQQLTGSPHVAFEATATLTTLAQHCPPALEQIMQESTLTRLVSLACSESPAQHLQAVALLLTASQNPTFHQRLIQGGAITPIVCLAIIYQNKPLPSNVGQAMGTFLSHPSPSIQQAIQQVLIEVHKAYVMGTFQGHLPNPALNPEDYWRGMPSTSPESNASIRICGCSIPFVILTALVTVLLAFILAHRN